MVRADMQASAQSSHVTNPPRGLLISIHDVTPAFDNEVRQLWHVCRDNSVTPALLVVPDWHGTWPLESHPEYVQWLRERARDGAEIILHGERHDEHGLSRGLGDAIRAFGRTSREGEFLTLNYAEASSRIERGIERLQALGLHPTGFIPPAWLARDATHDAVRALGLDFSEDEGGVRLHRRNVRLLAPALRWSGRTDFRARTSVAVADIRWRLRNVAPLTRIALHPQDLTHPHTATSVSREVARWSRAFPVLRYAEL